MGEVGATPADIPMHTCDARKTEPKSWKLKMKRMSYGFGYRVFGV